MLFLPPWWARDADLVDDVPPALSGLLVPGDLAAIWNELSRCDFCAFVELGISPGAAFITGSVHNLCIIHFLHFLLTCGLTCSLSPPM